jgi:hypothetical protein
MRLAGPGERHAFNEYCCFVHDSRCAHRLRGKRRSSHRTTGAEFSGRQVNLSRSGGCTGRTHDSHFVKQRKSCRGLFLLGGRFAAAELHSVYRSVDLRLRQKVERSDLRLRRKGNLEGIIFDTKQFRQRSKSCSDKPSRRNKSFTARSVALPGALDSGDDGQRYSARRAFAGLSLRALKIALDLAPAVAFCVIGLDVRRRAVAALEFGFEILPLASMQLAAVPSSLT